MKTTITATLVHHRGGPLDQMDITACVVTDTGRRTSIVCGIEPGAVDEARSVICDSCPFRAVRDAQTPEAAC